MKLKNLAPTFLALVFATTTGVVKGQDPLPTLTPSQPPSPPPTLPVCELPQNVQTLVNIDAAFAPIGQLYCAPFTPCEQQGLLNAAAGIALDISQVDETFLPFCLPQVFSNYNAPDNQECPETAPTAITTFFKFERTSENYHEKGAYFATGSFGQEWCYNTTIPCSRDSLNDFYNRSSAYEFELTPGLGQISYHTIIGAQCAYDNLYLVRDPEAFCSESPPDCTDIGLVDVTFADEDTVTLAYCRDGCIDDNAFTDITDDDILEVLEGYIVNVGDESQDPFCLSSHHEFIDNPVVALSESSFDKDSYCASEKAALRFQVGKCGGDALDDFVFHPLKDSIGGDIGGARIENGDVSDFAAVCRKHPDCLGFNSNGWVKKTLLPSDQWSDSFVNPYSGLYVKKQCFDYDRIDDWPCSVRAGLGMCQFAPPSFTTDDCKKTCGVCIEGFDGVTDRFHFYQGKDSHGGDIVPYPVAGSLFSIADTCWEDPECKGFNSNGWIKRTINNMDLWYTWTDVPTKGLFLKNPSDAGADTGGRRKLGGSGNLRG